LNAEKRSSEANAATTDKTSLLALNKEKDVIIDSQKRQLNELREELHQREDELEKGMRRQIDEDREKGVMERKEKSKLQKELEILEKNYQELDHQRKREVV
jgi:polyhydroxyalkanoate synthesis regulator phasin